MINNADGKVIIDTRLDTSGAKKDASSLGSVISKGAKLGTAAIAGVGTAAAVAGGYALQVGMSFEQGMSKVSAISGATGKDLDMLTDKAKEMGAKTKFSATEATEAFQYMAMAGWKTGEMLDGIEGIMNLAAASGEDLATTSDIVTDALTAFGLSAKDSSHFADVLAAASSNANTNVSMLGESFKYVAPVAGALGYSVEDISVALSLMANSGIKASQGGTALRRLLTNLTKPSKAAANVMKELDINIKNADGTVKPFNELMGQLRTSFSKLTDAQKAEYAASLAGQTGMSGLLAIVNSSDKDFEKLTKAINNADGASEKMAETMQNNLQGQLTILKSSIEGLGIALYEQISKQGTSMVKVGQKYVNELKQGVEKEGPIGLTKALGSVIGKILPQIPKLLKGLIPMTLNFIDSLVKSLIGAVPGKLKPIIQLVYNLVKSAIPALKLALGGVLNAINQLLTVLSSLADYLNHNKNAMAVLKGIIVGITTAWIAWKVAMALTNGVAAASLAITKIQILWLGLQEGATLSAAAATASLNIAMLANPAVAITAAIVGLTAAIIAYSASSDGASDSISKRIAYLDQENERIEKETEAIKKSTEELQRQNEQNNENAQGVQSHMDYIKGLTDELFNLADETGRVHNADKARAEFILEQLNDALGTEYELTGNQIKNYKKMKKSIYDVIEAKTNELMLSQYQQTYVEALKKRGKEEEKLQKIAKEYKNAEIDSTYATERLKEAQEKASMSYEEYYKKYGDSSKDISENRANFQMMIGKATDYINARSEMTEKEVEHTKKLKKQYDAQRKKVETLYTEMVQYESGYIAATEGNSKKAQKILTADTNKFNKIGTDLTEGVAGGMSSAKAQKAIAKSSKKVADMTIDELRKNLDIHSPSRKAKKLVGYEVARGVVAGFEEEEPFKQIEADIKKGTASLKTQSQVALNNSVTAGFDYKAMTKAIADANIRFQVNNRDFARAVGGVI